VGFFNAAAIYPVSKGIVLNFSLRPFRNYLRVGLDLSVGLEAFVPIALRPAKTAVGGLWVSVRGSFHKTE